MVGADINSKTGACGAAGSSASPLSVYWQKLGVLRGLFVSARRQLGIEDALRVRAKWPRRVQRPCTRMHMTQQLGVLHRFVVVGVHQP